MLTAGSTLISSVGMPNGKADGGACPASVAFGRSGQVGVVRDDSFLTLLAYDPKTQPATASAAAARSLGGGVGHISRDRGAASLGARVPRASTAVVRTVGLTSVPSVAPHPPACPPQPETPIGDSGARMIRARGLPRTLACSTPASRSAAPSASADGRSGAKALTVLPPALGSATRHRPDGRGVDSRRAHRVTVGVASREVGVGRCWSAAVRLTSEHLRLGSSTERRLGRGGRFEDLGQAGGWPNGTAAAGQAVRTAAAKRQTSAHLILSNHLMSHSTPPRRIPPNPAQIEHANVIVAFREKFRALAEAFPLGDVGLLSCEDSETGAHVAVLATIKEQGSFTEYIPIALMIDGDPYARYRPPKPEGGYYPVVTDGAARFQHWKYQ